MKNFYFFPKNTDNINHESFSLEKTKNQAYENKNFTHGRIDCGYYVIIRGNRSFGNLFHSITGLAGFRTSIMGAPACQNPTSGGTIAADQHGCNPFDPAFNYKYGVTLRLYRIPGVQMATINYRQRLWLFRYCQ